MSLTLVQHCINVIHMFCDYRVVCRDSQPLDGRKVNDKDGYQCNRQKL